MFTFPFTHMNRIRFSDTVSLSYVDATNENAYVARDSSHYSLTGAWSLGFWIKSSEFSTATNFYLGDVVNVFYIYYDGTNSRLSARVFNSGGNSFINATGLALSDDTWHHVIFDYDGTNTWRMTLDGGTPVVMTTSFTADNDTWESLKFIERTGFTVNLDCFADEWCLLGKTLSAGEIATLYNGGKAVDVVGKFGADCKGFWREDEGMIDLSSLGYDATYVNSPSSVEDVP